MYIFIEEVDLAKVLQVSVLMRTEVDKCLEEVDLSVLMRTEVDKFLQISLVVVAEIVGLVSQQQTDGFFLGKGQNNK
eukprot:11721957-Ditylum_brightwellii.AAC.1